MRSSKWPKPMAQAVSWFTGGSAAGRMPLSWTSEEPGRSTAGFPVRPELGPTSKWDKNQMAKPRRFHKEILGLEPARGGQTRACAQTKPRCFHTACELRIVLTLTTEE